MKQLKVAPGVDQVVMNDDDLTMFQRIIGRAHAGYVYVAWRPIDTMKLDKRPMSSSPQAYGGDGLGPPMHYWDIYEQKGKWEGGHWTSFSGPKIYYKQRKQSMPVHALVEDSDPITTARVTPCSLF